MMARGYALLLAVLVSACSLSTGPEYLRTDRLFVAPTTAPCTGVGPQTCLRVRTSANAPYSLFYDSIKGFTFVAGYEYELLVAVYEIKNPPADGSSLEYRLVREVRRTPVAAP